MEKTNVYTINCKRGFKKVQKKPRKEPLYLPFRYLRTRLKIISLYAYSSRIIEIPCILLQNIQHRNYQAG